MNASRSSAMAIVKQSASEFSEDDCPMMAAALSYYTAFALPPLLVLIVTIAGWIWSTESVTGELERQVTDVVGKGGWQQMETMMEAASDQTGGVIATLVGVLVLLAGATGVMVQLQSALNKAWEVQPDPEQGGIRNFLVKRVLSLAMILAVAFLLIVSLVLTAVLNAMGGTIAGWLPDAVSSWVPVGVHSVVSLLVFALLFAAMFKWLPDADVRWRDVWVGAVTTAVLFMLGKIGLGLYFSMTEQATYGAAASFVLLLLWVYYSGMIFLFGAEFTQVWARKNGGGIAPADGAVRVVQESRRVGSPPSPEREAGRSPVVSRPRSS